MEKSKIKHKNKEKNFFHEKLPSYLYKFYSLNENENSNNKKNETLKSNQIWVDTYKNQNDPFEFINLNLKVKDKDKNNPLFNGIQTKLDNYKRKLKFASFTTKDESDILMWSHYANCSKGFCCKFEVIDKEASILNPIMQMIYSNRPSELTIQDLNNLYNIIKQNEDKDFIKNQKVDLILEYIKTLSCNKANCWHKEKEYRITYYSPSPDIGENIKLKGLKLVAIYVGCNCKKEYIDKLRDFCLDSSYDKIEFYKMKKRDDKFELYHE